MIISKVFSANAPGRVEKFVRRINYLANSGWSVHILTPREPDVDFETHIKNLADSVNITVSTLPSAPLRSVYYSATFGDEKGKKRNETGHDEDNSGNPLHSSISAGMSTIATAGLKHVKPRICLPDSWIEWGPIAIKDAESIFQENEIDVLFTSCYPFTSHLVGLWLKRQHDVPWITEFRDPWMNNPLIRKPSIWKIASKRFEKQVVKASDKVVIHNGWFPDGKNYFKSQYPNHVNKVTELPYVGYDDRVFDSTEVETPHDEFTIVHAGNFYGEDCSPETFLRALATLKSRGYDDIRAEFLGGFAPEYQQLADDLGLSNRVKYVGVVPYIEVPEYLKRAHIGLWVMSETQSYESNVPSKVFDYIGAELPILALVPPGDCTDFVEANGLGNTASPTDQQAVTRAILELRNAHIDDSLEIQADPSNFSRSNSLATMKSVIKNVSYDEVKQ